MSCQKYLSSFMCICQRMKLIKNSRFKAIIPTIESTMNLTIRAFWICNFIKRQINDPIFNVAAASKC